MRKWQKTTYWYGFFGYFHSDFINNRSGWIQYLYFIEKKRCHFVWWVCVCVCVCRVCCQPIRLGSRILAIFSAFSSWIKHRSNSQDLIQPLSTRNVSGNIQWSFYLLSLINFYWMVSNSRCVTSALLEGQWANLNKWLNPKKYREASLELSVVEST